MPHLRQKMVSGLFWSAIERFGQQGIQLVITIIIARILTPADYGLIGMLAIFIAVAQSFVDSGFGSALIQKQDASQTDFSTIFYFNIIISILFFFILFFSAPLIAKFYKQPILTIITRIMALNIIINSFGLIQNTILTKTINFKTLTKVSFLSIIFSGTIGIVMAYKGFGVWSLVFQTIGGNVIKNISLWVFNKWRPSIVFCYSSLKSLFFYGSKLLASGLLDQIFNNMYNLVIGKKYNAIDLGYYTQAQRIQSIPVISSLSILDRVTFPLYSTIQNDDIRLKNVYKRTIKCIVYINFPLMLGLLILAPILIKLFLTDKWLPATIYLQLFCLIGPIYALSAVNLNILKVKGRTDIFLYLEIVKKIIIAIAIIITLNMGVLKMVIGQVVANYFCFILNLYYSGKLLKYSIKDQFLDITPYAIITIAMGIIVYIFLHLTSFNPILGLIISSIIGSTSYFILSKLLKMEAFIDVTTVLTDFVANKASSIFK